MFIILGVIGCINKSAINNQLEEELDNIPKGISINEIHKIQFKNFKIDVYGYLEGRDKDFRTYWVQPYFDSLNYLYDLNFMDSLYTSWTKTEKKDLGRDFTLCDSLKSNFKRTNPEYEHIKLNFYKNKTNLINYYTTCNSDMELNIVKLEFDIDINSFNYSGEFGFDSSSVYGIYSCSDGELIYKLKNADKKTFQILKNSTYGKDHKNIYNSRKGIMELADLESFKPITGNLAIDKNNIYFWDKIISDSMEIVKIKSQFGLK